MAARSTHSIYAKRSVVPVLVLPIHYTVRYAVHCTVRRTYSTVPLYLYCTYRRRRIGNLDVVLYCTVQYLYAYLTVHLISSLISVLCVPVRTSCRHHRICPNLKEWEWQNNVTYTSNSHVRLYATLARCGYLGAHTQAIRMLAQLDTPSLVV